MSKPVNTGVGEGVVEAELDVSVVNRIATVTLNRPHRRNAITLAMWKGLAETFARLSADAEVRAVILTGAGRDFSSGADIAEFDDVRADARQADEYEKAVDACSEAIARCRQPTVAALRGYCLGGACHLALACDFRIGDSTAVVGIPSARLSIVYGVRSTQRLLAIVGLPTAKRLLLAAAQLDAEEALRVGFLDRLAVSDREEAQAFAGVMAENAPLSMAGSKAILDALAMGTGALDLNAAEHLIAEAASSRDYHEARAAFAAKRKPDFRGH